MMPILTMLEWKVSIVRNGRDSGLTMLFAVYNRFDWCAVRTQDCLLSCLKVYPVLDISLW
jgi:hypothetical protein